MNKGRITILTLSAILLISSSVLAEDYNWIGDSGSWFLDSNWDNGIPQNDSNVSLISSDSKDRIVYYDENIYFRGFESSFIIDSTGTGSMTLHMLTGGILTIQNPPVSIGHQGSTTIIIDGGIFSGNADVGPNGTVELISGGMGIGSFGNLTIEGNFNQWGGRNHNFDYLILKSGGQYNLIGGSADPNSLIISEGSVFNQTGGSIDVVGSISIGGNYIMSGGSMELWGFNTLQDTGVFNQSGGINSIFTSLRIEGTYNLSGGKLEGDALFSGGNIIVKNGGIFNYSGGELNTFRPASFTNNGTTNLFGEGTRTINGDLVNNGTLKTTNTIAYYNGTFTNNGAYISDPATQYFTDLIIGKNGYLVGQLADAFKISGNLISSSIMNTDWNTRQSYLQFITGTDSTHDFYLTGADFGANMPGYANNFAWGTLDVTGNIVHFFDGNSEAGAALYLREILGLDITDMLIANLFGFDGLDIYYMANLPDNRYLKGLTYDLAGGGHLAPIPTPEPSTMLLLGSGLAGLVGYGRRRLKK